MKKILINESQLNLLIEDMRKSKRETYFNTFSGAVQYAKHYLEDKGYTINEDDWFNEVNVGVGKPKPGNTTRISLRLSKDGKELRKQLQIQVYNMGLEFDKNYELNFYTS